MSGKVELHRHLQAAGYQLGPFASKETLTNVIRLHSAVQAEKHVNVAELSDVELRKTLTKHGLIVGPVTNQTRSIYQRKLLEVLTNEQTEGREDEIESEQSVPRVPPKESKPAYQYFKEPYSSPFDIPSNSKNTVYPNLPGLRPAVDSSAPQTKTSTSGLRDPLGLRDDEPLVIRHDFRKDSKDSLATKPKPVIRETYKNSNNYDESNDLRARPATKFNESPSVTSKLDTDKLQVSKSPNSSMFYTGITVVVALFVFILYMWLEK